MCQDTLEMKQYCQQVHKKEALIWAFLIARPALQIKMDFVAKMFPSVLPHPVAF